MDEDFTSTKACFLVKEFILLIQNSLKTENQIPIKNDNILFKIQEIIQTCPLSEEKGRYANPGMVKVIEQVSDLSTNISKNIIDADSFRYLSNSFGNKIRMDFGTGHELNFLCFLFVNYKKKEIALNEVSQILKFYFSLVKLFIKKFNVEAAGSRGVWSIDDYLLLPYLLGSVENFNSPLPIDLISGGMFKEACEGNRSVMLKEMCKLTWPQINIGLYRMYVDEVLGRYVVTQHFIYTHELPKEKLLIKN
jgi:serine/threonine-protein phosphatase 2A activator